MMEWFLTSCPINVWLPHISMFIVDLTIQEHTRRQGLQSECGSKDCSSPTLNYLGLSTGTDPICMDAVWVIARIADCGQLLRSVDQVMCTHLCDREEAIQQVDSQEECLLVHVKFRGDFHQPADCYGTHLPINVACWAPKLDTMLA